VKCSPPIDLSEIHCLDVHDLPPEAWEVILKESKFPFPIVTFKENGVWRAISAEQVRAADCQGSERP
jgi:hypothetical protein